MASAEPEATLDNLVVKKSSTSLVLDYFGFETTDVQQKKVLRKACRGTVRHITLFATVTPYEKGSRKDREDTEVLESINNALHSLQEFTDALSGEAYASVSYLKPVLHLLRTSTLAENDEDADLTKAIKPRALGYMEDNTATQPHRSFWTSLCSLIQDS
ncbi:hypothetical protein SKAU_G00366760 [Synaphobranchus kaupii]|uniref:Uncharacterized protein n=1 Tax=Synaphobranchus kaupii TaxID=118154 RepID=A0A9Q1IEL2_SYNKA|nr:hypothetical protein SKAU_G00366760 [Synaphobranchus kaupii]